MWPTASTGPCARWPAAGSYRPTPTGRRSPGAGADPGGREAAELGQRPRTGPGPGGGARRRRAAPEGGADHLRRARRAGARRRGRHLGAARPRPAGRRPPGRRPRRPRSPPTPTTWPGWRPPGRAAASSPCGGPRSRSDPVLAEALWPHVTAVLTSATVPPLVEDRLGLPRGHDPSARRGQPFPLRAVRSALLRRPSPRPPQTPTPPAALHDELEALITAAGGRALALFTSWRAMQAAVEALRPRLAFRVLAQNELPKAKLLEAFAAEESSCLFATMSFWQGVDVPGATLEPGGHRPPALSPSRRSPARGPPRTGRGRRLPARRPPPGHDAAGPGGGAPHPVVDRHRGGGRPRPAPGHGRLPPDDDRRPPPHALHHQAARGRRLSFTPSRRHAPARSPAVKTGRFSSPGARSSRAAAAIASRRGRRARRRRPAGAGPARRCPPPSAPGRPGR